MVAPAARAPTRVAIDVTSLLGPRTGVGRMVEEVVSRLATRPELELTGVTVSWRGGRPDDVLPPGCRGRTMLLPARVSHALWRRFDRPRLTGFDVVHGPNYVAPAATGARLVTVHDLTAWRFPELVDRHSRHYPELLRRAVDGGAHVHAVSEHVAAEVMGELGVGPDRVHAVRNGFAPGPAGDATAGRARVGAPYVLAIGTVEPRKDYPTLIDAMLAVWDAHPDLRLVIVGQDGWGAERLDERIAATGTAARVLRLGYVSEQDKADLLAGACVLAYPSIYEGFGFPILEAMAAGIPVVSTTAGAIPETAGRAAVLVAPRDPSALAGALLSLVEDDSLRDRLAEAGRRRAALFRWDHTVDRLVDCYRSLAGHDPADVGASSLVTEGR